MDYNDKKDRGMGTKKIMIVLVLSIELLALGIYYGRLSAKEYTDYFVAGNELDAQYGDGEAFLQFQTLVRSSDAEVMNAVNLE